MSFGPFELIIILAIVLLLFGTKRLRSLGSDLGSSIRGFKKSVKETDTENPSLNRQQENTVDAEVTEDKAEKVD